MNRIMRFFSKPQGPLEIVEKDIPDPATHQVVSKFKHAAYVTVIQLLKKGYCQASNIQGFLGTKS